MVNFRAIRVDYYLAEHNLLLVVMIPRLCVVLASSLTDTLSHDDIQLIDRL